MASAAKGGGTKTAEAVAKLIGDKIIDVKEDGSFHLDLSYFDYCTGLTMTNQRFADLFGEPKWVLMMALAGFGLLVPAAALTGPGRRLLARFGATAVRPADGKCKLNGSKMFISNGNIGDYYIVLAKTVDPARNIGTDPNKPVISALAR